MITGELKSKIDRIWDSFWSGGTVATEVFPFLQQYGAQIGGDDSSYSDHMKDARFTIPTLALLSKVVDDSLSNRPNIPKLNRQQLERYLGPLPPLALQQEFAARAALIGTQRAAVNRAVDAADELFASLQCRAFRGDL